MERSAEYELSYLLAFKYLNVVILHPFHLSKTLMQVNYRPVPLSPKISRKIDIDTYLHEKNKSPEVKSLKRDGDGYAYTPYHESIVLTVNQQIEDHGILSLYSGHAPFYYISIIDALARPLLESLIAEYLGIDEFDSTWTMSAVKLVCHLATSLLTLPFEILNTRQIVQHPKQATYVTTTQGLGKISQIYSKFNISSYFLTITVPYVMHRSSTYCAFRCYDPLLSPIRFSFVEFALNCSSMLIELPLETIVKRQFAKDKESYPTRIPLSDPKSLIDGYNDLYDETCCGNPPLTFAQKMKVHLSMCRGYGMNFMVNVLIFVSHVVMALDERIEMIEEPLE